MAENDQKGWFGSYSSAGRNSAEKYHVIVHKEEILANLNKKMIIKDIFSPDENKQDDSIEEHIDIFRFMPTHQNQIKKQLFKKDKEVSNDRLHYHNKHQQNIKKGQLREDGPITKCNPKMDYVWKRTISGPPWKTLRGRKKNQLIDCKDFYIKQNNFNWKLKGFIDLNKQTMRAEFPTPIDIRIKNEVKYNPQINTSLVHIHKESTNANNHHVQMSLSNSKVNKFKNNFSVKTLPLHPSYQNDKALRDSKRCFVPDFKRNLSRDQLDKRFNRKKTESPFFDPNYNAVLQRPIMMVTYNKSSSLSKSKEIKGMNSLQMYDKGKLLNQKSVNVPNFDHMIPRPPGNNDPLPSYMKQIYTRASVYNTTDQTLQKNNYANAQYLPAYTSFYPKKSFNSIINLNLLHSEHFTSNPFHKRSEVSQLGNYLSKAMNFYKKNYDEEMYNSHFPKIDAVTFKSNKRSHIFSSFQLEEYLANIDDNNNNI